MFFGEKAVQDVLTQGITDLLADRTLLTLMLDGLPETEQAEALQWFRENGPNNFTIAQAFPRSAPTLPMVAVLPGGLSETDEFIGNVGFEERQVDRTGIRHDVINFVSSTRALILSPNANATSWLAAFCVFTLARYRNILTDQGLYEQTVQASDLNAAEEFQPELVFSRAVTLSGKVQVVFPTALAAPASSLTIQSTWNNQDLEVTTSSGLP